MIDQLNPVKSYEVFDKLSRICEQILSVRISSSSSLSSEEDDEHSSVRFGSKLFLLNIISITALTNSLFFVNDLFSFTP